MYYRLRKSFNSIPLADDVLLFRSDTRSYKVDGQFAAFLRDELLASLDGKTGLQEIASRLGVPENLLNEKLAALSEASIFEVQSVPFAEDVDRNPRDNLAMVLSGDPAEVQSRLANATIALFGLEGVGAILAEQLLSAGFRRLLLVDPSNVENAKRVGDDLRRRFPNAQLNVDDGNRLDRARVLELARGNDLLLACCDIGFDSANHWVNRAAAELHMPAVFCRIGGLSAWIGPFVIPSLTSCFMCSRMRAVASAENADEAMACEQFFDRQKQSQFQKRDFLPTALAMVAATLATDVYKYIVLQYQPALLGKVFEFDPMTLEMIPHHVLEHPQCPVCAKKKRSHVIIPAWRNSSAPLGPPTPCPSMT